MGPRSGFTVRTEARNGVAKLALSGDLDLASRPVFEDALEPYREDGVSTVVVDLRDLTFIDTQGIHAFQAAHDRAAGHYRLLLIGANPMVRRVFEAEQRLSLLDEDAVDVLDRFTLDGRRDAGTEGRS